MAVSRHPLSKMLSMLMSIRHLKMINMLPSMNIEKKDLLKKRKIQGGMEEDVLIHV
jgi:hypothetical protein